MLTSCSAPSALWVIDTPSWALRPATSKERICERMRSLMPKPAASSAAEAIRDWCRRHIGQVLTITCVKDFAMVELYDDRCVQVRPNTGELVGNSTRGLA